MDKSDVVIPSGMESYYDRLHFAPAVRADDRLYCAGVIGVGADGKASDDPETQFTRAFELLGSVLTAGGVGFADVVDVTTFHVGLREHVRTFAKVKDRFLREPYPAWTAIGVSELLVPGGLVEIKVIARRR
jgi:enamine deaminase RidA (YjgF/YER057c/UK114 family)